MNAMQKEAWVARLGPDATATMERSNRFLYVSYFGGITALGLFMAATSLNHPGIALAGLLLFFLVFVPLRGVSIYFVFKVVRMIRNKYDLSRFDKVPMRALKKVSEFDKWLHEVGVS